MTDMPSWRGGDSPLFVRVLIVTVVFPVTASVLYTPFYIAGLVIAHYWPNPGPTFGLGFFALSLVAAYGGAFHACRLMWPKSPR